MPAAFLLSIPPCLLQMVFLALGVLSGATALSVFGFSARLTWWREQERGVKPHSYFLASTVINLFGGCSRLASLCCAPPVTTTSEWITGGGILACVAVLQRLPYAKATTACSHVCPCRIVHLLCTLPQTWRFCHSCSWPSTRP